MSDPLPLRPGDPARVGDYELAGRLGEGGQGVVYLGVSPTGAAVAVKLLRADLAQDEEALARFVREVSTAERVATFCTAQVIETGVAEQRPYIVSEYIDGPTLAAVVQRDGPRQGSALHRLAIGTVTALVAIHQAGIVHRDFKPSNVLLGADGPRVIDFGIAKALDKTSTITSMVVGTPAYMTPEQLGGEQVGPAADMFAWAGTMVFAATGEAPFGSDTLPAVFHRIMSLEADLGALSEPLRGIVADCLAKDPAARPSAGEVLMRLLGQSPASAPAPALMAEATAVARASAPPPPPTGTPPPVATSPAVGTSPVVGAPPPVGPPTPVGAPWPADGSAWSPQPSSPAVIPGPGERRTGRAPMITAAAAAAVVLVLGGGYLVAQAAAKGTGTPTPTRTSDAPVAGRSTSPAATPSATAPSPGATLPTGDRKINLPGSSIAVYENDGDPIKLTSYGLDYGKYVYVRARSGNSFSKTGKYFEYTVSNDGLRGLGTDTLYTKDSYSTVSLVDRRTGETNTIRMSRAPVYPTSPQWSPDGTKALVTLNEAVGDSSKGYGYAVIDVARRSAKIVQVTDKDVGHWTYFWRGDGKAVGTWAFKGSVPSIRFYDLTGGPLRTLVQVGTPLTVDGDDVSPSGTRFVTTCSGDDDKICVWTTEGKEETRIPFPSERLVGWYDDQHVAAWRKKGDGYEAVVVDFQGVASRVLATAKDGEYQKMYLRYTRAS
ncbi:serine/threonine-protein kinase [Sphaerisporangium fuscum]|uniref:serine/threonine-protein kinase n=1 Tax=Sphaerisporangium fuscum TaxID=2835868 RepID=UPI001BDD7C89|nr:serine/threonine-protein kinase [Sphaerisporangium fuscum]